MSYVCRYGVVNCTECRPVFSPPSRASFASKPVEMTDGATILAVPFAQKDQAKALGAKWNPERKVWFVPAGRPTSPFKRWFSDTAPVAPAKFVAESVEAPNEKPGSIPYEVLMEALAATKNQPTYAPLASEPVTAEMEMLFEKVGLKAGSR